MNHPSWKWQSPSHISTSALIWNRSCSQAAVCGTPHNSSKSKTKLQQWQWQKSRGRKLLFKWLLVGVNGGKCNCYVFCVSWPLLTRQLAAGGGNVVTVWRPQSPPATVSLYTLAGKIVQFSHGSAVNLLNLPSLANLSTPWIQDSSRTLRLCNISSYFWGILLTYILSS